MGCSKCSNGFAANSCSTKTAGRARGAAGADLYNAAAVPGNGGRGLVHHFLQGHSGLQQVPCSVAHMLHHLLQVHLHPCPYTVISRYMHLRTQSFPVTCTHTCISSHVQSYGLPCRDMVTLCRFASTQQVGGGGGGGGVGLRVWEGGPEAGFIHKGRRLQQ